MERSRTRHGNGRRMDLSFSQEQLSLARTARDFAERELAPRVQQNDEQEHVPRELIARAAALGLMEGVIPEEYGGSGLDYVSFTLIIEEIAKVDQIFATLMSFPSGLAGAGILRFGSDEQKRRYLVPFVRGERLGGAGVTEPGSGTDVAAMRTTVTRDGGDYVVNGAKAWISNLDHADWFLTFGTLDPSLGRRGICAFIIEKEWPGVEVHPVKNKTGFRPIVTGELRLNDVRVPRENLVGKEGEGFAVAMCAVENGRLAVAARACGVTASCLAESSRYARERIVFERPIAEYQLIQSKIADMVVGLETARALTYRLAWLKDQGLERCRKESSMAKMYATDVLMRSATDAAQIFGAYSASPEYPVSRYFRDAKFFQIVEGTNELHRLLIAEEELGLRQTRPTR
ncbi:butyryl-CoA dehydrogenase [bacterium]|nr:MAG: butyryl-CoA dehydrogenase [bacterium]